MDKHTVLIIVVIWLSILFVIFVVFCVIVEIDFRKEHPAGLINENSLKTLKDQLKKSKAIDQRQADRINTQIKEILTLLRQKKITRE